jgi:hypothetical protein
LPSPATLNPFRVAPARRKVFEVSDHQHNSDDDVERQKARIRSLEARPRVVGAS